MKIAIYARYSTDNQRDASIADQFRVCRAPRREAGLARRRSSGLRSGGSNEPFPMAAQRHEAVVAAAQLQCREWGGKRTTMLCIWALAG